MGNCNCCGNDPSGATVEQLSDMTSLGQPAYFNEEDTKAKTQVPETTPPDTKPNTETAPAKAEAPPAPPAVLSNCEFTIKLAREDPAEPWGMGLRKSAHDDSLFIVKPVGKALEEWARDNPTKMVKKLDEVISVNGTSGSASMTDIINTAKTLEITLRRQVEVKVELSKSGPLGLKILPGSLTIGRLTEGMLNSYNKQCPPNLAICKGDQLVSVTVDGVTMDKSEGFLERLAAVSDGSQLTLVFARASIS